ncbi:MAG: hypothetical protein CR988_03210 [Treponema sp.]|nr:MAG: hypothetical protein CR988_03210 [Treponema sp.]
MSSFILKAVQTIDEFDASLFNDFNIGVELQDFTEPCLTEIEICRTLCRYEKAFSKFLGKKSMHGSFIDVNLASFNRDIAKYSQNLYTRDLFFAKVLNLDYVVFHSQTMPWFSDNQIWDLFVKSNADFFHEAIDASGFKGIVVLENVVDKTDKFISSLIRKINHPQVKLNLDTGHANLSRQSTGDWIKNNTDILSYMHLHSNNGCADLHNPVTEEDAELVFSTLEKYNLEISVCLEYQNVDLKDEAKRLEKILCKYKK